MKLYTPAELQLGLMKAALTRRNIGTWGKLTVYQRLEKAGWLVSFCHCEKRGDLRATNPLTGEVLYIEVKTARQGRDKKWRFTLVKDGCTDYRDSDKVVLLAVLKSGDVVPFIIPVSEIPSRRQICITSHPASYTGWAASYRVKDLVL